MGSTIDSDTVRVIDALAVHKDAGGEIEVQHLSNLTTDEAVELGSKPGGFRLSHGFISPPDLVEIGLLEAEDLHAMETAATGTKQ